MFSKLYTFLYTRARKLRNTLPHAPQIDSLGALIHAREVAILPARWYNNDMGKNFRHNRPRKQRDEYTPVGDEKALSTPLEALGLSERTAELLAKGGVATARDLAARRMREMSAMQPGMSFYGEMPDSFNFVLNTDHALVKKVLADEETACAESLKPILADIKGWEARQADLRESQSKKKEEEITAEEKEDMTNTNHKLDELRGQRDQILADYAKGNNLVSQLIDLALLGNGMLKGEALSRFIKRSVEMIG